MMRILLFLSFIFIAAPQQAEKHRIDPDELRQPLAFRKLTEAGPHSVSINRRFSGERERELLSIAEAIYPPRDEVLKCMRARRLDEKEPREARPWSCGETDGTDLPYAITRSAVVYFIKHSQALRRGQIRSRYLRQTTFSYEAGITHEDRYRVGETTFQKVHIVTMRLYWHQTCAEGPPDMCSMIIKKSRTVVLDKNGSVLATEGDGAPIPLFSQAIRQVPFFSLLISGSRLTKASSWRRDSAPLK